MPADRAWLLRHLDWQARYLAALTTYARLNPDEHDLLVRVRDEVFTLRETLEALAVPAALASNADWQPLPKASHHPSWPSAADVDD